MARNEEDPFGEIRKVIYDDDNECVINVDTPQSDNASKQYQCVDVGTPERICEESVNGITHEVKEYRSPKPWTINHTKNSWRKFVS